MFLLVWLAPAAFHPTLAIGVFPTIFLVLLACLFGSISMIVRYRRTDPAIHIYQTDALLECAALVVIVIIWLAAFGLTRV